MGGSVAVQDRYPDDVAHCYGCGRLNDAGYQIKTRLAAARPYAEWIDQNLVTLDDLPEGSTPTAEEGSLVQRQQTFGYTLALVGHQDAIGGFVTQSHGWRSKRVDTNRWDCDIGQCLRIRIIRSIRWRSAFRRRDLASR